MRMDTLSGETISFFYLFIYLFILFYFIFLIYFFGLLSF